MRELATIYTPSNHLHIPTRKEFHREFAGKLCEYDFSTSDPNKYASYQWTHDELKNANKHGINRPVGMED